MVSLQQIKNLQSLSSYYKPGTYSKLTNYGNSTINYSDVLTKYRNSQPKPSKEEAKAKYNEKHAYAERNRRSRIGVQYAKLRPILPNLVKKDKASILGEAIRSLTELNTTVSQLKASWSSSRSWEHTFPSGKDYIKVEHNSQGKQKGNNRGIVKVKFSCEDKKTLMADVSKAVNSINGKVVKAEMVIIGGRIECELLVQGINGNERLGILRNALGGITSKHRSRKRIVNG